ncbi:lipid II:glycine glycyltransferase FemX [Geodermatophilus sp. URMC 61]|uniref:lipid II:glycine glycyltransferase FemX n=1 Tax=Geodermatophilus sp. URMC 61 TaxID=3423411 RepID=UPI00406D24DC
MSCGGSVPVTGDRSCKERCMSGHPIRAAAGDGGVPWSDGVVAPPAGSGKHVPDDLHVRECDPTLDDRWDRFVADHPDGHIYQSAGWFSVVTAFTGHAPTALMCEDGAGRLRGVLPMVCRPAGLLSRRTHYYSSLPHSPFAGPLADSDEATAAMLRAAAARVEADPGTWLSVRSTTGGLDQWLPVSVTTRTTYVRELPPPEQPLRFGNSHNHGVKRRAVEKVERSGVRVRAAETESDLRAWYRLYLATMRRHVVLPMPYRFFLTVWRILGPSGHAQLLLAEQERGSAANLLVGSLFLRFGGTVMYAKNGRDPDEVSSQPNDAILWRAMHDAWKAGYRYFDLGEVRENQESLGQYKMKWGARPQSFHVYRYPYAASSPTASRDTGTGRLSPRIAAASRNLWQRVPLRATAAIGERWYSWY